MKTLALLLFAGAAPALFAQSFEAGMSFGESVLSNAVLQESSAAFGSTASKISLTDGFRFGFRIGVNTTKYMGFEVGYAYNRSQFHTDGPPSSDQGMAIHQGFGDGLIYATKEGSRIRPFAAGGLQFSNFVPPGSSVSSGGGQTKFGFNYGAGVKVKVAENWLIRFDFRQYESGIPDFNVFSPHGRLFQNEISAGFAFAL